MNPTHDQNNATAQPIRNLEESAGYLAGLFSDADRFRAWIATAASTASQPLPLDAGSEPDGYTVTETGREALDEASAVEAPGTAPRVLRSAALYLERHGWIQGAYYDATEGVFTPAACLVGAIGMVCYGGPVDAPAQHFDDPGFLDFEEAVLHLDRFLLVEDGSESYEFNDAKGRRVEDVTHVLRQAADSPAEELIDAIRAIETHNADMAALAELLTPAGIWGETADQPNRAGHVDYPHTPGTLYDCPACEADCFCADGFRCVHCALEDEQNTGPGVDGGDSK
jgi:hypothetical protein